MAGLIDQEEIPGPPLNSDQRIKDYSRVTAREHQACGTRAMKLNEEGGVVDSAFKV